MLQKDRGRSNDRSDGSSPRSLKKKKAPARPLTEESNEDAALKGLNVAQIKQIIDYVKAME